MDIKKYAIRQPLGVVAIIPPFNLSAMLRLWFFSLAFATGDTLVPKPSDKDLSASMFMARLLEEAGLPAGVVNVVNGDKEFVDTLFSESEVRQSPSLAQRR